ncbi:MAG: MoaD/ThiS family protein [Flavobacterium sp.]|uniref:MoaD/ThiS family protein n=1 Tax=Flavobacterium sp. TaxID=239 RepID=UPI00121D5543|nr:MoaD/ThiS family protein [Flavobacterium sp.]RZJ64265.1 MAG: MoaD/ThiS family protein [Flavobacterium sp.]
MKVLAFGQIAEITGKEFNLDASDVENLRTGLIRSFPELSDKKFAIAVNKKVISENIKLTESDEIALMPPYSGG